MKRDDAKTKGFKKSVDEASDNLEENSEAEAELLPDDAETTDEDEEAEIWKVGVLC